MNRFRESLESGDRFVITCELVPARGFQGKGVDQVLKFAEEVRDVPEIQALSLTDNAGGNPALSADVLGTEILQMGVDLIVHFSCKDMNRNVIESRAYALQRFGITNLLIITGDYPIDGYLGLPKPVFDMDSVTALQYLSEMNHGLAIRQGSKSVTLDGTSFYLGASVSPFKWTEGPNRMQYLKMEKKMQAGAHYFISQLGYDSRKSIELIRYARDFLKIDTPIMGSVYVLSAGAAKYMNRGEVPGCYVDEKLLRTVQEESNASDKGRLARIERAAKQISILKGLGYSGAHIEGLNLKYRDVREIIDRSGEIETRWEEFLEEFACAPPHPFYLFESGEKFAAPERGVLPELRQTRRRFIYSPTFWLTRLLHVSLFEPDTLGYRFVRAFSKFVEHKKLLYKLFGAFEKAIKKVLFNCRQCDDCALFETFYVCPEGQCPKGMRQGPCGGSRVDGHCEVFPDRPCIWARIYDRAKNRGQCAKLRYVIPPRDWKLYETNSWVNYFLKYDHSAKKIRLANQTAETVCRTDQKQSDQAVEKEKDREPARS